MSMPMMLSLLLTLSNRETRVMEEVQQDPPYRYELCAHCIYRNENDHWYRSYCQPCLERRLQEIVQELRERGPYIDD